MTLGDLSSPRSLSHSSGQVPVPPHSSISSRGGGGARPAWGSRGGQEAPPDPTPSSANPGSTKRHPHLAESPGSGKSLRNLPGSAEWDRNAKCCGS